MIKVCAWCSCIMTMGTEEDGVTHGMCQKCKKDQNDKTKDYWSKRS